MARVFHAAALYLDCALGRVHHASAAAYAHPSKTIRNLVLVLRCYLYAVAVPKFTRDFVSPPAEAGAVRLVQHAADHEVGEVAVLVSEDVMEAAGCVDHLSGEVDCCYVAVCDGRNLCWGLRCSCCFVWGMICGCWLRGRGIGGTSDRFAAPICSSSGRIEFVAPVEVNAARRGGHRRQGAFRDALVEAMACFLRLKTLRACTFSFSLVTFLGETCRVALPLRGDVEGDGRLLSLSE